ncbi:uncharacterized protein LOC129957289 [Argiope bruennichi]|uniref:uncharacterized protein LOC129957289 n=1 Tax=Argiope bruennichi TaxID=94029 RepID=UPI002493DA25|nr:uncharacterized protein LOC129957289 [Argiope bruennichi]
MRPQGVINVKRITIKRDGEIIETKRHILTFKSPKLPEYVYAGYIKLSVKTYIPNPLRCFRSQCFGHSKLNYRGSDTCARCAEKGHDSQQCVAPEKCVNYGDNHTSYSRSCPRWQLEKQIATIKIKENITYPEARRRVQAQTPTPGITYASVVQKTFCANCSCANCIKQSTKTTDNIETSHSDTENSISNNPDPPKETREKPKRKSKTSSLTLRLAKRDLSQKDLPLKLKAAKSKNSVSLGLATDNTLRLIIHLWWHTQ